MYGITPEQLKDSILSELRTEIQALADRFQPVAPPEYLSRKETAEILKVSLVTLFEWNKKGVLQPYRLGNLIRYKRSELEAALVRINQPKRH